MEAAKRDERESLLDENPMTDEELDELRRLVDQRRKEQRNV